jgi:hypothetical protein
MNKEQLIETEVGIGSTYNTYELTKEEEKQLEKDMNYFQSKADKYGITETIWSLTSIRALSLPSPFKAKWMDNSVNHLIRVPLPNRRLTGKDLWLAAESLHKLLGDTNHRYIEHFQFNADTDTIEVFFGS